MWGWKKEFSSTTLSRGSYCYSTPGTVKKGGMFSREFTGFLSSFLSFRVGSFSEEENHKFDAVRGVVYFPPAKAIPFSSHPFVKDRRSLPHFPPYFFHLSMGWNTFLDDPFGMREFFWSIPPWEGKKYHQDR